jgi:hypothetical protein
MAEASMKAVEIQFRSTASIANSEPIAGRAIFTAELIKGVMKAARVAMTSAARCDAVDSIRMSPG